MFSLARLVFASFILAVDTLRGLVFVILTTFIDSIPSGSVDLNRNLLFTFNETIAVVTGIFFKYGSSTIYTLDTAFNLIINAIIGIS